MRGSVTSVDPGIASCMLRDSVMLTMASSSPAITRVGTAMDAQQAGGIGPVPKRAECRADRVGRVHQDQALDGLFEIGLTATRGLAEQFGAHLSRDTGRALALDQRDGSGACVSRLRRVGDGARIGEHEGASPVRRRGAASQTRRSRPLKARRRRPPRSRDASSARAHRLRSRRSSSHSGRDLQRPDPFPGIREGPAR